jgi:nitrogen fixation protein FixH
LVSTNYYEQELKYDEQILKEKNTSELAEDLRLNFDKDKQAIKIQYPSEAVNLTGEISFVRPDDAKLDFNVKIMSDNTPMQSISTTQMKKGRWNIKVNWRQNERGYYHKQTIFIK